MNRQASTGKFAFWKAQAPVLVAVFSFIAFMQSESATKASLFGMLAVAAIGWQIHRQRSGVQKLGQPVMQLGGLYAEPPSRMRPWHLLATIAFALLGLAMFFSMSEASLRARLGMSLVTWAIVGAWLVLLSKRLQTIGAVVMGGGFATAGVLMTWEAWTVLTAGEHNANLNAVRWSVFGGFLLLVGVATLISVARNSGQTPIYSQGVVGPHGYVPWAGATRLELVEWEGRSVLAVGAYKGWTLWIDVPDENRDDVAEFIAAKQPTQTEESKEGSA